MLRDSSKPARKQNVAKLSYVPSIESMVAAIDSLCQLKLHKQSIESTFESTVLQQY